MHRKLIYLINPVSGIKKKSSLLELIAKKTREARIDFDILYTNASGDYEFLKKKITDHQITDIVICGGDGTVNVVAGALRETGVNIGIIPAGSGNGLAYAAKIPRQASRALDVIFKGKATFIDALHINNQFSCMLCGIGFDALVAQEFAKQKRRGLHTYIKLSLNNFFKAKPYSFHIANDNLSFSTDAFLISIANGNQFGNNFTIAPKASLRDGLLDIVIVKNMNKFVLPFSVLRQVTGKNGIQAKGALADQKNIIYFQTPSLSIRNDDSAPLHIDGEPAQTSRQFDIRVIPDALRLIQP